jgi:palmitoyltransferase ZDHHC9/14/18
MEARADDVCATQVLTLALVICTSAIHLYLLTRRDHIGFGHALGRGAGSAVAFSLSMLVIWPITALLVYHMRLLLLNVTTIEQVRTCVFADLASAALMEIHVHLSV